MGIKTLKTGTPVTIKESNQKAIISGIANGQYRLDTSRVLYSPRDLIAEKVKPAIKKRIKISSISKKRAAELLIYKIERIDFLKKNKICLSGINNCSNKATDIHHKKGRYGKNFLDKNTWLPICREHHQWITEHSSEAISLGLSSSRNNKHN